MSKKRITIDQNRLMNASAMNLIRVTTRCWTVKQRYVLSDHLLCSVLQEKSVIDESMYLATVELAMFTSSTLQGTDSENSNLSSYLTSPAMRKNLSNRNAKISHESRPQTRYREIEYSSRCIGHLPPAMLTFLPCFITRILPWSTRVHQLILVGDCTPRLQNVHSSRGRLCLCARIRRQVSSMVST